VEDPKDPVPLTCNRSDPLNNKSLAAAGIKVEEILNRKKQNVKNNIALTFRNQTPLILCFFFVI
jgi:hypothetical protein